MVRQNDMSEVRVQLTIIVTGFGKRDLFDKNIILRNKQLKMAYIIITTIANRILVIFMLILSLFFYLTVQCDKL